MTEPEPLNPGHQVCASCWFWEIGTEYCHAAMGITDPAFSCSDWRDLRDRRDPLTGEALPALAPPILDRKSDIEI